MAGLYSGCNICTDADGYISFSLHVNRLTEVLCLVLHKIQNLFHAVIFLM